MSIEIVLEFPRIEGPKRGDFLPATGNSRSRFNRKELRFRTTSMTRQF